MAIQEIKNRMLDGVGNKVLGDIRITSLDTAQSAKRHSRAGLVPAAALTVAMIAEACSGNATTANPGKTASTGVETPTPGFTLSPEMANQIRDVVKEAIKAEQSAQPPSSPDTSASAAPTASPDTLSSLEAEQLARPIPVPEVISGSMARELKLLNGETIPMYSEGEWFHPVYDPTQEGQAQDYRGIGPWYPVAYENVDKDAAVLTTHGNVGELIVSGRAGGKVMVAFMQLDKHQNDGAWGTNPATGRFEQNPAWEMQYNFHSLAPLQEIWVIDPDTGKPLTWSDGSPVIYRANEDGIAAFEIPATKGNDVRVGFVFDMPAQGNGKQPPEVKIERGPNDNPGKTGENPLPDSVLKPMVPEK